MDWRDANCLRMRYPRLAFRVTYESRLVSHTSLIFSKSETVLRTKRARKTAIATATNDDLTVSQKLRAEIQSK